MLAVTLSGSIERNMRRYGGEIRLHSVRGEHSSLKPMIPWTAPGLYILHACATHLMCKVYTYKTVMVLSTLRIPYLSHQKAGNRIPSKLDA